MGNSRAGQATGAGTRTATGTGNGPAGATRDEAALPDRIRNAVIACLDEFGYAATSIQRIQEQAAVSRGALTYHFASKEDLMVETAEHLLRPTLSPRRPSRPESPVTRADVVADINWMWTRLVDTREGRALLEILVAARSDKVLRTRISPTFTRWNRDINDSLIASYPSTHLDSHALDEIWTICRVFLRGLNTQRQFDKNDAQITALTRRFGQIIADLLVPAEPPEQREA
ncbi:MAG: TetR/AcrR family transcriptional regulator [Pararhodobacter sp.]